jgi:hypothetical protein
VSVNAKKTKVVLPIGRTARIACQLEVLRTECCRAAEVLVNERALDEYELEECARLDDALAQAQRQLKGTVARIILSRLRRRSGQEP